MLAELAKAGAQCSGLCFLHTDSASKSELTQSLFYLPDAHCPRHLQEARSPQCSPLSGSVDFPGLRRSFEDIAIAADSKESAVYTMSAVKNAVKNHDITSVLLPGNDVEHFPDLVGWVTLHGEVSRTLLAEKLPAQSIRQCAHRTSTTGKSEIDIRKYSRQKKNRRQIFHLKDNRSANSRKACDRNDVTSHSPFSSSEKSSLLSSNSANID